MPVAVFLAVAMALLLIVRRRPRRGAYRFIVALRPLAHLLTDDRTQ